MSLTFSAPAPVRLTVRGRAVIIMAVLVALLLIAVGWVATSAIASDSASNASTTEWVVQPGESLWQIAEEATPTADPRDTVFVIMELNGLDSSTVTAGQTLRIPA